MPEEFVMRGQTASDTEEVLNFSGYKPGYAYRLVEFQLYPSNDIGGTAAELAATITAAKTAENPVNPNFNNEGLIGVAYFPLTSVSTSGTSFPVSVINDTFLITQNLILKVIDKVAGAPMAVNWQCRFVKERMNGPETAAANYKQYLISDGS